MASTSVSSIQKSFRYEVFLSFRGDDTRKNFVDHLYHALESKSIHTYKDDQRIKKGKRIGDELIRCIQDSRFHIIVFSKNYASSSWCLDELVKIMECQKTSDQTAYPVFYDVEPTEVRKQCGAVGEAFAKHEKHEAAGKWREAMKEAADLAGWELKNIADGHEAKFIQKMVEEISLELRFIDSSVDGKLIGMQSRVKDVVSALETGSDDVQMIGIKGMGGGGKTTLARAVFDHISSWFEGKSFVENVREVSKSSLSGLKKLQKQVLSDVLNDKGIKISSVHDGKNMMKKMMRFKRVLVVLDDVDCIDQLEALAGEPTWFRPGSRIIITTRDEQVLVAHRVNLISDVKLLSDEEAICLFSRYAFGKEIPIHGYEELSRQVVRYAAGLPLTIRVLGSFLCGKTHPEWIDALKRLKTIPLKDTLEKLELSYIGLEEDYKEIFLDVACIFKGWKKEKVVEALESYGFHARNGLRVLEQKSLITVSQYGSYLGMHDHIEEMGKNIVRRLHPNEPRMHSRLWILEEIKDILTNELGTEATRCIKMQIPWNDRPETFMRGFGKMKKVRVVDICDYSSSDVEVFGQCFPHALRYLRWVHRNRNPSEYLRESFTNRLSSALRYLRWEGYPFKYLMKSFQADHLVGLSLHGAGIIYGERKVLPKLRFLDMSDLKLRTLDLEMSPNIETLSLVGCQDLLELIMPNECPKLKSLSLDCAKLRTLNLGSTPDLETLILKRCHNLLELHMPNECPKLKSLSLDCAKLRTLNLGSSPDLETLSLVGCKDLLELNMPNEYPKLKSLSLDCSKLRTLNLGSTPDLEMLSLKRCHDLLELHMTNECPKLKSLCLSDSKLRTLDLGLTPNLERLDIKDCFDLTELHCPIGCLEKLVYLNLSDCGGFKYFLFDKNIQSLKVGSLHLIVGSVDIYRLHSESDLQKFLFSCLYGESIPSSIANLRKLISVRLCTYPHLESFSESICNLRKLTLEGSIPEVPNDLDRLQSLEELSLLSTKIKHLPDSICMLKNLKLLELNSCFDIEKLPEGLGLLECLEDLNLTSCIHLQDIPKSICDMKRLKCFNLSYCVEVKNLPRELGRLECLKELNILLTDISDLPDGIFELEGLRIVASDGLSFTV